MRLYILFSILLIELSIIGFLVDAQGEQWQPTDQFFNERAEIHIINVWVQQEGEQCPPDCHIYPLRLISKLPEECGDVAACFIPNHPHRATGIYIINGLQGERPHDDHGGCSILWHEIKHAAGIVSHDQMAKMYPNERCAVG